MIKKRNCNLYNNKYRIESTRLKNWDYGWNHAYFVTICTKYHTHYLGEIKNEIMNLSETGSIAKNNWFQIPINFPYVLLGEMVIMPNHIHGIIIIEKPYNNGRDAIDRVSTITTITTPPITNDAISKNEIEYKKPGGITGKFNPMINDNLSKIIRWYKGRTTFESRKIENEFAWQPRFYDRIIRDNTAYKRISEYIKNNPANWKKEDCYVQ